MLGLPLPFLQQPDADLLKGDDALCPVLEVLDQDGPVHLPTQGTTYQGLHSHSVLTRISLNRKNCLALIPDLQDLVRTPSAMRTRPLTARVWPETPKHWSISTILSETLDFSAIKPSVVTVSQILILETNRQW